MTFRVQADTTCCDPGRPRKHIIRRQAWPLGKGGLPTTAKLGSTRPIPEGVRGASTSASGYFRRTPSASRITCEIFVLGADMAPDPLARTSPVRASGSPRSMSQLAARIVTSCGPTPRHFAEVVEAHPDVAWRELNACGRVRAAGVLGARDGVPPHRPDGQRETRALPGSSLDVRVWRGSARSCRQDGCGPSRAVAPVGERSASRAFCSTSNIVSPLRLRSVTRARRPDDRGANPSEGSSRSSSVGRHERGSEREHLCSPPLSVFPA